jgi:hypothetical protein
VLDLSVVVLGPLVNRATSLTRGRRRTLGGSAWPSNTPGNVTEDWKQSSSQLGAFRLDGVLTKNMFMVEWPSSWRRPDGKCLFG